MHTIYSVDCSDNRGTVDVFNFNAIYMWLGSMVSLHIHNLRGECDTPGPGSMLMLWEPLNARSSCSQKQNIVRIAN